MLFIVTSTDAGSRKNQLGFVCTLFRINQQIDVFVCCSDAGGCVRCSKSTCRLMCLRVVQMQVDVYVVQNQLAD